VEKQNTLGARATMSMLGYISGFVDTLGFIALFALFPAHITGNFAALAATAMAVQNTAARTSLAGLPPTTVMTGNLMQIIVDLLDVLHGHGAVEAKRARLANLVSLMLSFSAGAITGAVDYLTIGFRALVAPILAALTLGLFARPHPAKVA